jgi:hypothetical protein
LLVLIQAYLGFHAFAFVMACVMHSIEHSSWLDAVSSWDEDLNGHGARAKGDSDLDEMYWFCVMTLHGIGFGEFMPRSSLGRIAAAIVCGVGYWVPIYLGAIVLLSQLPGEKMPSLCNTAFRIFKAVWPSYMILLAWTLMFGAIAGANTYDGNRGTSDIENGHRSDNVFGNACQWCAGMWWMFTTVHRQPYGDVYPNNPFSRALTFIAAMLGNFYIPYALALIAVRKPNMEQHQSLLENLRSNPKEVFGRGYTVPPALKEHVMEEYAPAIGTA